MFEESRDDEFVAIAGSNMERSVSALVFTVNLGSYEGTNKLISKVHWRIIIEKV